MKIIHCFLIACILYLWTLPVYGSPMAPVVEWQPELTFVWPDTLLGLHPSKIRTDHFEWVYDPDRPYNLQVGRIIAFERFIHEIESRAPVATPEPGTLLLLASGLVGIIAVRRRKKVKG
jgi:hypothetical protein